MASPKPGPQSLYLYPFKWDEKKDKLILTCLIEKIEECSPTPPHLSPRALIHTMKALNSQLHADVSLIEVESRVDFLHDRYVCFKYLCNHPETHWDGANNMFHADDKVWQRLFKENAFFRAYYHNGEPEYLLISNLFGLYDVKRELSHTVIVIEDSSTVKKPSHHQSIGKDSSEDEVTSPILKPKPEVSRKLNFADDACSSAAPSFLWKSLKNKFRRPPSLTFPPRNAFPIKPKEDWNPDGGYGGSSCVSSSPFK